MEGGLTVDDVSAPDGSMHIILKVLSNKETYSLEVDPSPTVARFRVLVLDATGVNRPGSGSSSRARC